MKAKVEKKKRQMKTIKKDKNQTKKVLIIMIIFFLMLSILFFILTYVKTIEVFEKIAKTSPEPIEFTTKKPLANSTQAIAYLPAVDNEGNGVLTLLSVEAVPGSGRTLVDIDNILFWGDTQHSIRIAKNVASNITGIDVNNYDIVYNIYANASIIGGESAGVALALATIAVLQNKTLREDVMITGTINHDGTIGPVQNILAKAKAAKSNDAEIFLVPLLQSREIIYKIHKYCDKFGGIEFCKEEQIPVNINISKEVGIEIKEVGSIQDAMKYFFKD